MVCMVDFRLCLIGFKCNVTPFMTYGSLIHPVLVFMHIILYPILINYGIRRDVQPGRGHYTRVLLYASTANLCTLSSTLDTDRLEFRFIRNDHTFARITVEHVSSSKVPQILLEKEKVNPDHR